MLATQVYDICDLFHSHMFVHLKKEKRKIKCIIGILDHAGYGSQCCLWGPEDRGRDC